MQGKDKEFYMYIKQYGKIKDELKGKLGIYGTGNGAEIVYELLRKFDKLKKLVSIIDNDGIVAEKKVFHGYMVETLENACEKVETIIIAAKINHYTIYERVKKQCENYSHIGVVDYFGYRSDSDLRKYVEFIEKNNDKQKGDSFVEYDENGIALQEDDIKIIAWYLPQFHRIDVNDKYYGRGFTEWTNTSTTFPMFTGHYQPHIPYDVGYYDLSHADIMYRQVELAKHYGIQGFSFYYYWFSGKRIMEKPLDLYRNHKDIEMNYCVTWANENWSALWDGGNKNLIYEQVLKDDDGKRFIHDLFDFFRDERYIRINGKLLLLVYRINIWEKSQVIKLFETFREETRKEGLGELYIGVCNARNFDEDVEEWGADALVEFPPHGIYDKVPNTMMDGYINPRFAGTIKDMKQFINEKRFLYAHKSKVYYRGVFPYWDNSPRKAYNGASVYTGIDPIGFEKWMVEIAKESKIIHSLEDNIVFVNAWNEWAEGAHLEPDLKYGYANLAAIKKAIIMSRNLDIENDCKNNTTL